MSYSITYTKKAIEDIAKLKAAKLSSKVQKIIEELTINPLPPYSKKLQGDLANKYSIRINLQHRLVYELCKNTRTVGIIRMWGHYE